MIHEIQVIEESKDTPSVVIVRVKCLRVFPTFERVL